MNPPSSYALLPAQAQPLVPADKVKSTKDINYRQPYSCLRSSPLECLNQKLVKELAIIRRSRELEGQEINALAYERAIGVRFHNLLKS